MYLLLEMGIDIKREGWLLNLNNSVYGIKKASENWFYLLKTGLEIRGYHISQADPCVFYRKDTDILTYVYYCVIVFHKQETITLLVESIHNVPEEYALTGEGDISSWLGVNIKNNSDGKLESSQLHLVQPCRTYSVHEPQV